MKKKQSAKKLESLKDKIHNADMTIVEVWRFLVFKKYINFTVDLFYKCLEPKTKISMPKTVCGKPLPALIELVCKRPPVKFLRELRQERAGKKGKNISEIT